MRGSRGGGGAAGVRSPPLFSPNTFISPQNWLKPRVSPFSSDSGSATGLYMPINIMINVGLVSGRRRKRWANIKSGLNVFLEV